MRGRNRNSVMSGVTLLNESRCYSYSKAINNKSGMSEIQTANVNHPISGHLELGDDAGARHALAGEKRPLHAKKVVKIKQLFIRLLSICPTPPSPPGPI